MTATIKAIDNDSVHRLHAGQVVLELQGAIKELVENSLDASATTIDVRLKDHGLDSIEIVDNGSGIAEADWPYIALKHHTSKLPSLSEIASVKTFGFRGEALSALCALCDSVQITTATKQTTPMASIIKLGRDGRVVDSSGRVARPRGTTILLTGLFLPLPVRRKEFERTVKREFAKALTTLYAYALVPASASPDGNVGVRFKVESVAGAKGLKRTTLLSTDGKGSLRSQANAVWGPKALEGVMDIDVNLQVEVDSLMARREGITEKLQTVYVKGLISSAAWGKGRSSADRQFYYVNGRPCDLKQVGKVVNEVYKSFNTNQVPLAILDFQIPPESIDINVSPDKRTIFLHSETSLLLALRSKLEEFFTPSRSAYALSGASQHTVKVLQSDTQMPAGTSESPSEGDIEHVHEPVTESGVPPSDPGPSNQPHFTLPAVDNDLPANGATSRGGTAPPQGSSYNSARCQRSITPPQAPRSDPISNRVVERTLDTSAASWSPNRKAWRAASSFSLPIKSGSEGRRTLKKRLAGFASQDAAPSTDLADESDDEAEEDVSQPDQVETLHKPISPMMESKTDMASPAGRDMDGPIFEDDHSQSNEEESMMQMSPDLSSDLQPGPLAMSPNTSVLNGESAPSRYPTLVQDGESYRGEITRTSVPGELSLHFDMSRLRNRYATCQHLRPMSPSKQNAYSAMVDGSFVNTAGVGNRDAAKAEAALARVISKSDFEKMEVLGQFNKGFIIARLRTNAHGRESQSDDLFIIDQHASDEKFNFESLQRSTVINAQSLIKPRPLHLTAGDEIVAMENIDVLQANGFKVDVDEDKAPGRGEKISLTAMPVSKDITFDFKDLEQLLHMLSDGARPTGQMVRCNKARAMFAMRACRKSVMIGKPLTKSQMIQLLRNMATIDQPWNCPHGRPTMRHLTRIETSHKSLSRKGHIDWTKWKLHEV